MNSDDHDLLIKIHENTKDLRADLAAHAAWDNKRFMWVGIALVITASASGILPQLLTHLKLGGL